MLKVMLAANEQPNLDELTYPVLASGKIDGVRICIQEGQCVAGRSLKPSINKRAMEQLSDPVYSGMDGELTLAGPKWNDFNANQSAIMTKSGKPPKLIFHVFDHMSEEALSMPAERRKAYAKDHVDALNDAEMSEQFHPDIELRFCEQFLVYSAKDLRNAYDKAREAGYEGLIVMDPKAMYKHGRSTLKQGIMLKLKPSEDSEATIVGMEELMRNMDAGNSKCKENLVPGDMMGKLNVLWNGLRFNIGTGFTEAQRIEMWQNQDKYLGKLAKFKFMETHKDSGIPRSPVFIGIRHKDDLDGGK
ncbi:DNA ligase [Vibrio phage VPMS1]|uniref:DNA ligase n=1 Tax=Vibrio phage VPMS1 TaxID=1233488 RepID=UPI000358644E|nr:DNA ligase [Vibrio phage VPMS1]AFV51108.1 DNA ligase [Vibrio phage VPMS1]